LIPTDILFEKLQLLPDLHRQRAILFDVEDESIAFSDMIFTGMFEVTAFVLKALHNGTRMEFELHKKVVQYLRWVKMARFSRPDLEKWRAGIQGIFTVNVLQHPGNTPCNGIGSTISPSWVRQQLHRSLSRPISALRLFDQDVVDAQHIHRLEIGNQVRVETLDLKLTK